MHAHLVSSELLDDLSLLDLQAAAADAMLVQYT